MKKLLFLSLTFLMTSLLIADKNTTVAKQDADKNAIVIKNDTSALSIVAQQLPLNAGFINSFEVMTSSKKGKEIRELISKKENEFQQKLLVEEKEITKIQESYKAKVAAGAMIDDAALRKEKRKLEEKEEAYKIMIRGMQEDLNAMVQELTAELSGIVEAEIAQFAKQNNFDVIFDIATGRIVYCASHLNKTAALTTLVDNKIEKETATKVAVNAKNKTVAA